MERNQNRKETNEKHVIREDKKGWKEKTKKKTSSKKKTYGGINKRKGAGGTETK